MTKVVGQIIDASTFQDIIEQCLCVKFHKATRAVSQMYNDAYHPLGIRSTQVAILISLGHYGEVSLSVLANELVMSASTLSRNLRPIEKQGLIATKKVQRRKMIMLTERGKELVASAYPIWQDVQKSIIQKLGDEEYKKLSLCLGDTIETFKK